MAGKAQTIGLGTGSDKSRKQIIRHIRVINAMLKQAGGGESRRPPLL
jgi:hypothetical protein